MHIFRRLMPFFRISKRMSERWTPIYEQTDEQTITSRVYFVWSRPIDGHRVMVGRRLERTVEAREFEFLLV